MTYIALNFPSDLRAREPGVGFSLHFAVQYLSLLWVACAVAAVLCAADSSARWLANCFLLGHS